jgi:hypothetical protein
MIKDRFSPNDPIPLFLSGPNKETELSGVRKAVSPEVIRKAALAFAALAIVLAVVSAGKAILFASVTASQVSPPAPRDGIGHSTPAIQSTASAEAVPESQLGDDLAAALRSALENKAEADRADRARAEALFNQFQAWAAQEDAQALPGAAQSIQDVRAEIVQSPPLPKRRPTQVAHTARSQDSSPQNTQSLMRRLGFRN